MLLMSKHARHFLLLDLAPRSKPHSSWHGYRLADGTVESGITAELTACGAGP